MGAELARPAERPPELAESPTEAGGATDAVAPSDAVVPGAGAEVRAAPGDGEVLPGDREEAPGESEVAPASLAPVPRAVQVEVVDVVLDLPQIHPIVVLRELEPPNRSLRFPVSTADGQALAYALRKIPTPRPLTHELFSAALGRLGAAVEAVQITGLVGMTLLAEVVLSGPQGQLTLECRPSDGIALALRQPLPVPITVTTDVLDEASDPV